MDCSRPQNRMICLVVRTSCIARSFAVALPEGDWRLVPPPRRLLALRLLALRASRTTRGGARGGRVWSSWRREVLLRCEFAPCCSWGNGPAELLVAPPRPWGLVVLRGNDEPRRPPEGEAARRPGEAGARPPAEARQRDMSATSRGLEVEEQVILSFNFSHVRSKESTFATAGAEGLDGEDEELRWWWFAAEQAAAVAIETSQFRQVRWRVESVVSCCVLSARLCGHERESGRRKTTAGCCFHAIRSCRSPRLGAGRTRRIR